MLRKAADISLESSHLYLSSNAASISYLTNKTIVNWLKNRQNEVSIKDVTAGFPNSKQIIPKN